MCLTVLFASLSAICVQGLERRIPDFELNAVRSVIAWLPFAGYCFLNKINPYVTGKDRTCVALYAGIIFVATVAYFTCVTFIPMATEESIYHTTQMFGGMILFGIIVKEKPTVEKAFAAMICTSGVFLVVQPDFIFDDKRYESRNENENVTGFIVMNKSRNVTNETTDFSIEHRELLRFLLGCFLAFVAGITSMVCMTCVKYYDEFFGDSQSQPVVIFWTSLTSTVLSVIIMLVVENPVLPESLLDYFLVISHGVAYIASYPGYLYAFSVLDGNTANILWTTSTVYMVAAQYTVLKDIYPGHRNWIEIVGIGLVILGCLFIPFVQLAKKKYAQN